MKIVVTQSIEMTILLILLQTIQQKYSRNKYHTEALHVVCQQSDEGKPWKVSPFAKHTRGCKHPDIKYNNKLLGMVFENK